eukprot:8096778-Karenia_brevis.AAC.1
MISIKRQHRANILLASWTLLIVSIPKGIFGVLQLVPRFMKPQLEQTGASQTKPPRANLRTNNNAHANPLSERMSIRVWKSIFVLYPETLQNGSASPAPGAT